MKIQKQVAANIHRIRLVKEMSQEALALATGIDRAYMSGIERGKKNPTLEVLARIAQGLGVSVSDLVTASGDKDGKPKNLVRGRHAKKARTKTTSRKRASKPGRPI